jgi:hypothetical protein
LEDVTSGNARQQEQPVSNSQDLEAQGVQPGVPPDSPRGDR